MPSEPIVCWSFVEASTSSQENRDAIRGKVEGMRERGATAFRVTAVDRIHAPFETSSEQPWPHGFWVEGRDIPAPVFPAFFPPLTRAAG